MSQTRQIVRRQFDADALQDLQEDLHPVLRRVFAARQTDPAGIDLSLAGMIPISELEQVDVAADRLALARQEQQKVLVLGDFDVDGATATALMISCMRRFGFEHTAFMVPDRQKYGYGLSPGIAELAAAEKPAVIVTVDNGISSHAGVAVANQHGIDVVVTDHHLPGETLPDAAVIVNPNLVDSAFPSRALAGVGVAFYVMAALGQRLAADGLIGAAEARAVCADCLDLVALGTVADLVPLDQNNRVLVAQGMTRMRRDMTRPGIRALFSSAGRNIRDAATTDLAFAIAPRLNAAGRLDDMTVGINCLLADDNADAVLMAQELSQLNERRKARQSEMQSEADLHLDELEVSEAGHGALCLYNADWHQGVVGLVATKIKERINRPVIAFAPGETPDLLKGSGRSVSGVHLRDILANVDARHPELIDRYGGHAMAAGLSLRLEHLDQFREAFAAEVDAVADQIDDNLRLFSDGELEPADLNLGFAETLRHAAPWGQAFPEPAFDGRFEVLEQRIVGERHLKLKVRPVGGGRPVDGIAFNQPDLLPTGADRPVTLLYRLDVNEFRSVRSPQLVVEHIECD